jgi:hypothetical protein
MTSLDATENHRKDPIRSRYFNPLERAEKVTDGAFYTAAALSILVLLIERQTHRALYSWAQIGFLVAAILGFLLALAVRVYFYPRAQDVRFADFLSSGYGVRLIPERTEHYYNTDAEEPVHRIAFQALENSLFTKEITLRMCWNERALIGAYVALWLVALFNRSTDLDAIVWASQVVFSEQLFSRWIRLEWFRGRSEAVFDDLYRLLQVGRTANGGFDARVVQEIVKYENTKSIAAVTLSSGLFAKVNPALSQRWSNIRRELGG